MKIAIVGASGVYGRHLTPRLVAAGHDVRALVRRPEAGAILRACGAELRQADIYDAPSLEAGLAGIDLCINVATAVPGGPSGRPVDDRRADLCQGHRRAFHKRGHLPPRWRLQPADQLGRNQ